MQSHVMVLMGLGGALALLTAGYMNRGWGGLMLALGAIVFFVLLHITRVARILRVAAKTPKGRISSAVMLNARLREGMKMLEVVQQTRALSEPQGALGGEVEVHRWTDPGGAWVDCQFSGGRLQRWQLGRPEGGEDHPTTVS